MREWQNNYCAHQATFEELRDIVGATRFGTLRVRVECFITAADEADMVRAILLDSDGASSASSNPSHLQARVRDIVAGTVLEVCMT
jgi:hypothetical protein